MRRLDFDKQERMVQIVRVHYFPQCDEYNVLCSNGRVEVYRSAVLPQRVKFWLAECSKLHREFLDGSRIYVYKKAE